MTKVNPADALVATIYEAAKAQRWSRRQIAVSSSIHVNTLKHFGKPHWNPGFATLHKISAALLTGEGRPPALKGQQPTRDSARKHKNVGRVKGNKLN